MQSGLEMQGGKRQRGEEGERGREVSSSRGPPDSSCRFHRPHRSCVPTAKTSPLCHHLPVEKAVTIFTGAGHLWRGFKICVLPSEFRVKLPVPWLPGPVASPHRACFSIRQVGFVIPPLRAAARMKRIGRGPSALGSLLNVSCWCGGGHGGVWDRIEGPPRGAPAWAAEERFPFANRWKLQRLCAVGSSS